MSDHDIQPVREVLSPEEQQNEPDVESRRKFLKVSVAAGAAVAAVAAGVHFMPSIQSAISSKSMAAKLSTPGDSVAAAIVPSTSQGDALILVVEGDKISVYKGEDKYVSSDAVLAHSIATSVKDRI
jgi:hypothetical protein